MTRKLEALKESIFFAKENPEKLARLLEGLIADKLTSIEIFGARDLKIPATASLVETYKAVARSQFGDALTDAVVLSLKEAVTGVTLTGNNVTVESTCVASAFTLKAVSGTVETLLKVSLKK